MERTNHKFNPETYKKWVSNHERQKQTEVEYRKLRKSFEAACKIMEMTMPKETPEIPGYDTSGRMVSAKEFGGDFYTVFPVEEGKIAIAVGDVAGKDLEAAFTMLMAKALFENESKYNTGPANVTNKVNTGLITVTNKNTAIVTSIFGILDPESGEFSFARAGHEMPKVYDKYGNPREIDRKDGQPLNFEEDFVIHKGRITIPKGGMLVLTTDGVGETQNSEGDMFGLDGLDISIRKHWHLPAEEISEAVIRDVQNFEGNPLEPHDDRTIVVVKKL
jgi:serine phosphatase RsbU (regulator of sigma subunit)